MAVNDVLLQYPVPQDVSLLPVLRAMSTCTRKLEREGGRFIESLGVTPAQFEVLATLGDMRGMSCKELGDESLITQGTLHPVLDRLENKGLIQRAKSPTDQRQVIVSLTEAGQALYEETFLPVIAHMRKFIDILSPGEQATLVKLLKKLETAFI